MFTLMMPVAFKIGDTDTVRINGAPATLHWRDKDHLVINGHDTRRILQRSRCRDGHGQFCWDFICDDGAETLVENYTITTPEGTTRIPTRPDVPDEATDEQPDAPPHQPPVTALFITGPRRRDWRLVSYPGGPRFVDDIRRDLGGSFEYAQITEHLSVYVSAEGLELYPPFVRAVQKHPNPLYPDGVMVIHGPALVWGPTTGGGFDGSLTPDLMPLVEAVFIPILPEE